MAASTPLLDTIKSPADLRRLPKRLLNQVADELRSETIDAVSVTGGHLGAGLGVVELTVALHYVFDTPRDRLIWDVGHQAYPHKILTERRDRIRTLRQGNGLSGFTKRAESEYDPFGAAHSSTSLSAGLGMATARDLSGGHNNVICVIGDGAMSAGMAYEALNNAGAMHSRFIVILNDNNMSIAPPVGAMAAYLARIFSGRAYRSLREVGKQLASRLPKALEIGALRAEEFARGMVTGGTLFEELGFYYVGPIDGHKIEHLLPVLTNVRDAKNGPIIVHVADAEGQRLRAGREFRRQVSRRRPLRRRHRRAGKAEGERAAIHEGFRREPDQGGAEGRPHRRHHRRDAVRHRPRPFSASSFPSGPSTSASPSSTLSPSRRVSRRKATSRSARSTRPSCSAPMTRSCTTSRSRTCRCGLPWTAPGWSAPTARRMPARSTSPISDACRISSSWQPPTRPSWCTWWQPRRRTTAGPIALRYPRGEGVGVDMPEVGVPLEIGRGRIVREGSRIALLSFGTRSPRR